MVYGFISYSSNDVDDVRKFAGDLRSQNISYWRDEEDIPPWNNWDDEIQETLSSGKVTPPLLYSLY